MILVTGATGRIGRHLVAGLLADDAQVRALTRDPRTADLPAGAEVAGFDPGQPDSLAAALAGVTTVFVNATAVGAVIGPLMAVSTRAGVRRVVMLSSLTVRDDGDQIYALGVQPVPAPVEGRRTPGGRSDPRRLPQGGPAERRGG